MAFGTVTYAPMGTAQLPPETRKRLEHTLIQSLSLVTEITRTLGMPSPIMNREERQWIAARRMAQGTAIAGQSTGEG